MRRVVAVLVGLVMFCPAGAACAAGPSMEEVVRAPQDFAGRTVQFPGATLSGKITTYDTAGVRKYYLTLGSQARTFEVGFFLAPPALADRLAAKMNPETNYRVNITCRIEKLVINSAPQWHGIVTRVDFLNASGRVVDTVKWKP